MSNADNTIPAAKTLTFDGTVAVIDFAGETITIVEAAHEQTLHFDTLFGKSLPAAFISMSVHRINASKMTAWEIDRVAYVAGIAQRFLNENGYVLNKAAYTTVEELSATA